MRAYLISRQDQFDFDKFSAYYSSALTISWPYNAADVVMSLGSTSSDEELVASPIFEQHLLKLKNWNVSATFSKKFPDIGIIIQEEINSS